MQGKNGGKDGLGVKAGEGEGGKNGEINTDMYALS